MKETLVEVTFSAYRVVLKRRGKRYRKTYPERPREPPYVRGQNKNKRPQRQEPGLNGKKRAGGEESAIKRQKEECPHAKTNHVPDKR